MRASSSNGNGAAPPPPAPPPAAAQAADAEVPGPRNAFVPGQESESRRQLFNRISPVYDEVRGSSVQSPGATCTLYSAAPASTSTLPVQPPQLGCCHCQHNSRSSSCCSSSPRGTPCSLPCPTSSPCARALLLPLLLLFLLPQLNDRLSLGQHRLWKRMAVKWTRAKPGQQALDVCCGSGDLALLLADAVGPAGRVTGLDFAADMLQVGVRGAALGRSRGVA